MSEIIYPICFIDEVVVLVPEENQYVHIWNSDNEAATEDCDECMGYEVLDTEKGNTIDGGECDYNSESFSQNIHEKIPMVLDFIYDKKEKYEVVSYSFEDFVEEKSIYE